MNVFNVSFHADEKETKSSENDHTDIMETQNDLHIDKLKRSAVTAISAAAVKAKILANQEEDHIRQVATLLVEKQVKSRSSWLFGYPE